VSGENDMSVKDNLIAAKALIDTPRKYEMRRAREGSAIASAFYEIGCGEEEATSLFIALEPFWVPRAPHDGLMLVFDRAIAAQEA
jgi:hypothetical protein